MYYEKQIYSTTKIILNLFTKNHFLIKTMRASQILKTEKCRSVKRLYSNILSTLKQIADILFIRSKQKLSK